MRAGERPGSSWRIRPGDIAIPDRLIRDFKEPRKGNPKPFGKSLSNAHGSQRDEHSEKPIEYLAQVMKALASEDDLIFSLFTGLGTDLRAARLAGRRIIGAEIDPKRFNKAIDKLASFRGDLLNAA